MKKVMDTMAKYIETLTIVVYSILFLMVAFQMAGRWLNLTNVGWTDEMISCFTTWMVFLGCSYLVEQDGHISVDLFTHKLSPMLQKIMLALIQLLNLICAGFVVYSSQLWLKTTVGKVTPIL